MVQLIIGDKGEGKTKQLLDKVNEAIQEARGNIVYLDKSTKHMYELNNKIRLIDVSGFPLKTVMNLSVLSAESFLRITIWSRSTWTALLRLPGWVMRM